MQSKYLTLVSEFLIQESIYPSPVWDRPFSLPGCSPFPRWIPKASSVSGLRRLRPLRGSMRGWSKWQHCDLWGPQPISEGMYLCWDLVGNLLGICWDFGTTSKQQLELLTGREERKCFALDLKKVGCYGCHVCCGCFVSGTNCGNVCSAEHRQGLGPAPDC